MQLVIKAPSVELGMGSHLEDTSVPSAITQLTASMRRGDEEAYREFFRLYFHRLLAYLLVVTRGDEELARDLLQQTMIKVAKHIRVFEEEPVLWRWLVLLARTTAVDHGRKANRYFGFLRRFWEGCTTRGDLDGEHSFEEAFQAQWELLEAEDRAVLEKKYFDGLSVRQIAAELDLSEKAVESRLSRLRAKLSPRGNPPALLEDSRSLTAPGVV